MSMLSDAETIRKAMAPFAGLTALAEKLEQAGSVEQARDEAEGRLLALRRQAEIEAAQLDAQRGQASEMTSRATALLEQAQTDAQAATDRARAEAADILAAAEAKAKAAHEAHDADLTKVRADIEQARAELAQAFADRDAAVAHRDDAVATLAAIRQKLGA